MIGTSSKYRRKTIKYTLFIYMYKKIFFIITVFFSSLALHATPAEEAAKAYQQKDYIKAAQLYADLVKKEQSGENDRATLASYYYNWGNCLYRTKDYPQAVRAYQCALRINPADKDAAHNLQLTQSKLPNQFDERPQSFITLGIRNLVISQGANAWGYWGIALLFLTGICALSFKLSNTMLVRKVTFFAACTFIICTLLSFLFAYAENNLIYDNEQAVIMQPQQTYTDPSVTSKASTLLQEGVLVDIIQRQSDGWTEIELPDGTTCWTKEKLNTL